MLNVSQRPPDFWCLSPVVNELIVNVSVMGKCAPLMNGNRKTSNDKHYMILDENTPPVHLSKTSTPKRGKKVNDQYVIFQYFELFLHLQFGYKNKFLYSCLNSINSILKLHQLVNDVTQVV